MPRGPVASESSPAIPSSLWRLLRAERRGRWRALRAALRTVPGALSALLFIALFGVVPALRLLVPESVPGPAGFVDADVATAGLLLGWLTLVAAGGSNPLAFTEAEVHQLFAAPVQPAALLRYKLVQSLGFAVVGAASLGLFAGLYTTLAVAGPLLALTFLPATQLPSMVLTMALGRYRPPLWASLLAVAAVGGSLVLLAGGPGQGIARLGALAREAARGPAWLLVGPAVAAAELMRATSSAAALAAAAKLAAWDLLLFAGLWAGAGRVPLEVAAEGASATADLQRRVLRGGLGASMGAMRWSVGSVGGGLGAGPRGAWRFGGWRSGGGRWVALARWRGLDLGRRAGLLLIGGGLLAVFGGVGVVVGGTVGAQLVLVTGLVQVPLLLPSLLAADFRGDVDGLDRGRAWPVGPWGLFVGTVAPVVAVTWVAVVAFAGVAVLLDPGVARWAAPATVVGLPWCAWVVTAENVLQLIHPVRARVGTAAMHSGGLRMVNGLVALLLHALLGTGVGVAAAAAGWAAGSWAVAVAVSAVLFSASALLAAGIGAWRLPYAEAPPP